MKRPGPFGDIANYRCVLLTQDIFFTGGRLKASKGATGIIVGDDHSFVDVLFDEGDFFVERSGCGQRLQSVPRLYTQFV